MYHKDKITRMTCRLGDFTLPKPQCQVKKHHVEGEDESVTRLSHVGWLQREHCRTQKLEMSPVGWSQHDSIVVAAAYNLFAGCPKENSLAILAIAGSGAGK